MPASTAPRPAMHRCRRRLLRTLIVALLCGLASILAAVPAFAHTKLQKSDPADGASLDQAPARIALSFNESVPADFAQITVIGPGGTAYQTGAVTAADTTVSIAVLPLPAAGRYEVGYRVVSDDGHPITGSFAFTLTAAAAVPTASAPATTVTTPAPSATPSADAAATPPPVDSERAPVWPWIVGAAVVVGAGIIAALRIRRG